MVRAIGTRATEPARVLAFFVPLVSPDLLRQTFQSFTGFPKIIIIFILSESHLCKKFSYINSLPFTLDLFSNFFC